eukprot:12416148-Karenia_brevis.AAC.1
MQPPVTPPKAIPAVTRPELDHSLCTLEGKMSQSFARALSVLNSDLASNIQDTVKDLESRYDA